MNQTNTQTQDDDINSKIDAGIQETVTLKMLTRLINEMSDEEVAKVNELENDPVALKAYLEEVFGKEYLMAIAKEETDALKNRLTVADEASKVEIGAALQSLADNKVGMIDEEPEEEEEGSLD